jgi:hypothetical protein
MEWSIIDACVGATCELPVCKGQVKSRPYISIYYSIVSLSSLRLLLPCLVVFCGYKNVFLVVLCTSWLCESLYDLCLIALCDLV